MLRLLIKLFFILSFFNAVLLSQTIKSVKINGGKNFSYSKILGWGGINAGIKYYPGVLDSVKKRIASHFASYGYFNSSFETSRVIFSSDSQNVTVEINIKEGKPSLIKSISINGLNKNDSLKIIPIFQELEGSIFNKFYLEAKINDALIYYENNGYPFSKIIVTSVQLVTDTVLTENYVNILLKIDKGLLGKINKIKIIGNTKTKDYVVLRELRLEPGELYSQTIIDELPKKLNRLGFFDPVEAPDFYINNKNEAVLQINLKEKGTNNFDGIIGYVPSSNPGEGGYLTGLVNVSLRNLFGTGRSAAVRWQQLSRNTQELELKYLEPWLLGYPFNVNISFLQRKQDTSYVLRKFEGGVNYLATENVSAQLFASTEAVIPTISQNNFFTVYNSTILTTGVLLKIDTRDDPYSPLEGILFVNSYSYSSKKIIDLHNNVALNQKTNVNMQRFALDFSTFIKAFNRQTAAVSLHGRELRGSLLEVSDLYRLGGTNTLRGYRENQFLGSRIFWSNIEYRFALARRSFAFLFFDTGYYLWKKSPQNNLLKQEGFNIGYGIGLNIETGLGILGVSFALAKGDSFKDGKIHFGLVNEF